MEKILQILMVEDLPADAELIKREIKKSGILFIDFVVDSKDNYLKALQEFKPDIILSDYSLPSFDGMQALLLREELAPSVPFILVTGSINEETAVTAMKAGADDYVIKEHITRIGTAIITALEKREILRSKKEAEDRLKILSRAVEQNPASIVITNTDGIIEYVNPKFTQITGYRFDEAIGNTPRILKSGTTTPDEYKRLWDTITSGKEWRGEFTNLKKNGESYFESASISPIANENGIITHFLAVKEDITERKLNEETIKRNQLRIKRAQQIGKLGYWQQDLNRQTIWASDEAMKIYGFPPIDGELPIETIAACIPQIDIVRQALIDLIQYGKKYDIEFVINPADGSSPKFISSTAELERDNNGNPVRILGVLQDITERKQAEEEIRESEERFRMMFENVFDGISIFEEHPDPFKRRLIECNERYAAMAGITRDELLKFGYPKAIQITPEDSANQARIDSLTTKTAYRGSYSWIRPDGKENIIEYIGVPITWRGKSYSIGIDRDITEQKHAEAALIAAKGKAEESDRLKSAFLANMSHEIRTPLNSIIGFSELLLDPFFESEQHTEFAGIIKENGNNLLAIISDIMDLSKIEAGQVQLRKGVFSVNQLITDIQKEYSFKANEKGIELRLDPSNTNETISILSDGERIRQVLVNLVGNAIKFTEKGFIEIGIETTGEFVRFHVKDTGIGIPIEFQEIIFERFRQVETAHTRKYGGNGLGLPISKSLVELLGGSIWMESEQGKGSTFFFTVPR